jgi:predicted DNA-binding transcriptional regulator AlpA
VIREELAALKEGRMDDRLLKAKEAAKLLQVSPNLLYMRKDLPFRVELSGCIRFSYNGIQKYLERKLKMQGS